MAKTGARPIPPDPRPLVFEVTVSMPPHRILKMHSIFSIQILKMC
jgi:hypothetical protein